MFFFKKNAPITRAHILVISFINLVSISIAIRLMMKCPDAIIFKPAERFLLILILVIFVIDCLHNISKTYSKKIQEDLKNIKDKPLGRY